MTQLIKGKAIANKIKQEVKEQVETYCSNGQDICLVFIQVGQDSSATVYRKSQQKACKLVGIESRDLILSEEITEVKLIELICELNNDRTVNGIIVGTPLPPNIHKRRIVAAIDPCKDVDGFHPQNIGLLAAGEAAIMPCTPAGIVQLLKRSGIIIAGTNCVIVGRSRNVGIPMALLMLHEDATVTITHSKTQHLEEICQTADILIVAVGKRHFITREYVKEGAIVVDVGIHQDKDGSLSGDVDFESVKEKVLAITPVPGGVGPMTTAMLMSNCVETVGSRC